jgi:hypothetical protein
MLLYPHNRFSITSAAFFCVEAVVQKQGLKSRGSKAMVQKQWFKSRSSYDTDSVPGPFINNSIHPPAALCGAAVRSVGRFAGLQTSSNRGIGYTNGRDRRKRIPRWPDIGTADLI